MNYPIKEVRPGLYRGPRPALSDIPDIAKMGIKYVFDLEQPQKDEKFKFISRNIYFHPFPWSEIFPPRFDDMEFIADSIRNLIQEKRPVLIHCTHGVDRTGAAVFADRIVNCGWDYVRAYQEMLDNGHHVFFYWWWQKRLYDFAREVRK